MTKREIYRHIRENYSIGDLEGHVATVLEHHEKAINESLNKQIAFLEENCGLEWMEEVFCDEDQHDR